MEFLHVYNELMHIFLYFLEDIRELAIQKCILSRYFICMQTKKRFEDWLCEYGQIMRFHLAVQVIMT